MKRIHYFIAISIALILISCKSKVEKQYSLICNDNYKYWLKVNIKNNIDDDDDDVSFYQQKTLFFICYTADNRMMYFVKYADRDSIYKASPSDVIPASLWKLDNDSILSEAWDSLDDKNQTKQFIQKLTSDSLILIIREPGSVIDGYKTVLVSPPDSLKHLLKHPDLMPDVPKYKRLNIINE